MRIVHLISGLLVCSTFTLGACAGEDPMVWVSANALADQAQQCELSGLLFLPNGRLDVADTTSAGLPSARSYVANFLLRTNLVENSRVATTGGFTSYGSLSTNELLVEEVEISYDFTVSATPPSGATLDVIPQRIIVPASAHLGPDTKAGRQGTVEGSTFLSVKLFTTAISDTLNADPDIYSLLEAPNTYPVTTRVRLRGRTLGGTRFETEDFLYLVDICRGCLIGNPSCIPAMGDKCYPEWQDCR
jgi:hypothetical protein